MPRIESEFHLFEAGALNKLLNLSATLSPLCKMRVITAPMSQFPAHSRHSVMLTELSKSEIARAALAMLRMF